MPKNGLTPKMERFALNLFQGLSQRQAYIAAGYSRNMLPATADRAAYTLSQNYKIASRLAELQTDFANSIKRDKIADFQERQEKLTNILRADLVDFVDKDGAPTLSRDTPFYQAASEYSVTTKYNKLGEPYVSRSIKIRDPVAAIDLLNKMDRIYSDEKHGNTYNDIKVLIVYEEKKQLPEAAE